MCGEIEREGVSMERKREVEIECVQNDRNVFMSSDGERDRDCGGVQPHFSRRHTEIWIWGWAKMGKKYMEREGN